MFSIRPPTRGFWAFLVAALMAAVPLIAAEPVPANVPPRFAATVIKEGDRYLIQVPARPGQIYCLEVPDGTGGMTFTGVPGSAVYAQSDTVRWPLELSGTVVGAEEDGNSPGAAGGMNPFARPGESGYVDASNAGGSNGGNGGGIAPIWDSDDDFSPDFEEIAAGTSPMFKYSAPVVLTSQALYRSAVFDSWGSSTETQVWHSGWRPDVGGWLDAIFSHPDPAPPLGTTPRAGSAFMSDFASGWNAFGLPDPKAGKGLPPQKMFEESLIGSWASFARNVYLLNGGPLSGTEGYIRAFGYRYRLRGPSSSVPQARQFLELTWTKTSGFVPNVGEEAAAAALMEEAPVSVEPVTLTIPPGELYSEPHDMVSQGPSDPEMPHSQVGQYLKVVRLLPVEVNNRSLERVFMGCCPF